ncbi:MAG: hypothetical protein QNJ47_07660 [Nostocaceae cyanobacterium]|nr:hypothetical protein [Nostocaceae cyanobacterium]
MKFNSTVLLTLILLTLMLVAGSVSAFWGFALGSAALKGVTAPDSRPTTKFASKKTTSSQNGTVVMLKEKDLIKIARARVQSKSKAANSKKRKQDRDNNDKTQNQKPKKQKKAEEKLQKGFPLNTQSEGVSLSVQSARYTGGALELKVKMQNQGDNTVRFLYSFLDVTDDKGRTLSASTEGLPAQLPGKGRSYSGTVSIPTALLDEVKTISLNLTDYPAQKLRLKVSNIPVER